MAIVVNAVEAKARTCGDESVAAGRAATQAGWYEYATRFVQGRTVLDVGCGLGYGMPILRRTAKQVHGQDLDPRLSADDRHIIELKDIPDQSYDVIVSIDVIEHVEVPEDFLQQCRRISRIGFFLSTPNWTFSHCEWPYHFREYTPRQFYNLLAPYGVVTLFKGCSSGHEAYEVRYLRAYFLFNGLRNWLPTTYFARAANRCLPRRLRMHTSNGAWVQHAPGPMLGAP